MRNSIILCALALSVQGCRSPQKISASSENPSYRIEIAYPDPSTKEVYGMSPYIQSLLVDASLFQRIGKFPNGDVVFFLELKPTESPVRTVDGIGICRPQDFKQALLVFSPLFDEWKVLASNNSSGYDITRVVFGDMWDLSVVFKNSNTYEEISAEVSLDGRGFRFSSNALFQKVLP